MLEPFEPINVWVMFHKTHVEPLIFFWKGRKIKVETINLVHATRLGDKKIYHYSVSADGNFYRLGFDTHSLKWMLEAVEEN
jgi:hypothetical protein